MASPPLYNWLIKRKRSGGVLLHISSLPSDTGIGNFGFGAYRFVDFLKACGMKVWQFCPLGPTGFGDSPYRCLSAFAGNPYFIDLKPLVETGLVDENAVKRLAELPHERTAYGELHKRMRPILQIAYRRFKTSGTDHFQDYGSFQTFRRLESNWLEDYALFAALKKHFNGKPWIQWPSDFRDFKQAKTQKLSPRIREAVEAECFEQYLFFAQLAKLRAYARKNDIEIMGDLPIFVAPDSSDTWADRDLFQLKRNGRPAAVAGVPPDCFSKSGQLWGNPLYNWKHHQESNFAWWVERIRHNLELYDILRLDHFRGFQSYWSVPSGERTADKGEWKLCPGLELFAAIKRTCPQAKLVAENLGVITCAVEDLLAATGLPGMTVLQFAFDGNPDSVHLPHNHKENGVAYSGTHDNDTIRGWWNRFDSRIRKRVRSCLDGKGEQIEKEFIGTVLASRSKLAIIPFQDLLNLGSEARFNTPGTKTGNWQWRCISKQLDELQTKSSAYLLNQNRRYGRI